MNVRKFLLVLSLITLFSGQILPVNSVTIVKVQVNDNWIFSDLTIYNVTAEYSSRPQFADQNHLNSFQVEVLTNDTPFVTDISIIDDNPLIGESSSFSMTLSNWKLDHVLLSQRGVFLLYQSGTADFNITIGNTTKTSQKSFELITIDDGGNSPSVAVTNGEPVEVEMLFQYGILGGQGSLTDNMAIIFKVNYIPSDTFSFTYNGQTTQAVNITAEIYVKDINAVSGDNYFEFSPNTLVATIQRTFSPDIGLPLSEKIVKYYQQGLNLTLYSDQKAGLNEYDQKSLKLFQSGSEIIIKRELVGFSIKDSSFGENGGFLSFVLIDPFLSFNIFVALIIADAILHRKK